MPDARRVPQAFSEPYYEKTAARLNKHLSGNLTLSATDINAMLQLCSYETVALGSSKFCDLFTKEDFEIYEQAYDILVRFGLAPLACRASC